MSNLPVGFRVSDIGSCYIDTFKLDINSKYSEYSECTLTLNFISTIIKYITIPSDNLSSLLSPDICCNNGLLSSSGRGFVCRDCIFLHKHWNIFLWMPWYFYRLSTKKMWHHAKRGISSHIVTMTVIHNGYCKTNFWVPNVPTYLLTLCVSM